MSGGKDSSTTAALLAKFLENRRGVELVGVTIDEGIASYRPQGIDYARRLCARLGIEHRVLAYADTVGHAMDEVVVVDPEAIPCSYCGPFRREALNRAAREVDADYVATGLNLDDTAQSILMNVARGDIEKLARMGPHETRQPGLVPRIQPLRMIPEKEVYLYALLSGIEFHDATCPYAERAQRGRFRDIVHRLEEDSPGTRHAILRGYDQMRPLLQGKYPPATLNACARCGEPTVNVVCKACELRNGLPGWRRPARSSRPADYSVSDRRGPRPSHGDDPHGNLQLRLDEPEIFPHGFRESSPPFPCGRNPRRSAEIRPSLELAIDGLASGQGPHARGEFLDRLSIHAVADTHRDPVEPAEHVEFRHREAHEAVHADRHPKHHEIEPPDPPRPSGRRAIFASAPFPQMLGDGPVDFGRKRSRPDARGEGLRDA